MTRTPRPLVRRVGMGAVAFAAATCLSLLMTLVAPAQADASNERHYYVSSSSNPCPNYSIQNVLDDPHRDWDGDGVTNSDEIYVATLNPCVRDSAAFCRGYIHHCQGSRQPAGDIFYYFVPIRPCNGGAYTTAQLNAALFTDWDRDGVSNYDEVRNGANPCVAPCPTAYQIDVALNPHGDWDGDGYTNRTEVRHGSNPCKAPQPRYVQVSPAAPSPNRLPHVGAPSYAQTPAPVTKKVCPAAYPYFHPGNGLCYANPV